MILNVSRGSIKIEFSEKTLTIPGEMFFPENGKMGFSIYLNEIKHWDFPNHEINLTHDEINSIIQEIRLDFEKGGNILEVEI